VSESVVLIFGFLPSRIQEQAGEVTCTGTVTLVASLFSFEFVPLSAIVNTLAYNTRTTCGKSQSPITTTWKAQDLKSRVQSLLLA
jgi:hypothetical protein